MPPCLPCNSTRRSILTLPTTFARSSGPQQWRLSKRNLASASNTKFASGNRPNDLLSTNQAALTLVHKAGTVIPQVLDSKAVSGFARKGETKAYWNSVLSRAYNDLSVAKETPATIVVCGVDEWSGAQQLVAALLTDPLSSDKTEIGTLINQWNSSDSQANVSHGTNSPRATSSVKVEASYLNQFSVPIEIMEIRPPSSTGSTPLAELLHNPAIFKADIPIIVYNPLTTPLASMLETRLPASTIFVVSSSLPQLSVEELVKQHRPSRRHRHSHPESVRYIAADPHRAIEAIKTLQSDPRSLTAIQRYQDEFIGSRVSAITQAIRVRLAESKPTEATPFVQARVALSHVQDALCASFSLIHRVRHEMDQAFLDVSQLRETLGELQARVEGDTFRQVEAGNDKQLNTVEAAMQLAEQEMRPILDHLTWWRMAWRVDEISSLVSQGVLKTWCRDLEQQLILHTGRLSVTQQELTDSAFKLLSTHPKLPSAVLHNSLLQYTRASSHRLTHNTLTRPLITRRDQVIEYPTMRLHVAGQKVALSMAGGTAVGVGIGWAGWLGWLLGSGEGLLSIIGMDAGTAIGVAMLTTVGSIRWAVGRWEKAKTRWWQDWRRVGEGLDRDLKATLQATVKQQVVLIPETACAEMSKIIKSRDEELASSTKALEALESCLDSIRRNKTLS